MSQVKLKKVPAKTVVFKMGKGPYDQMPQVLEQLALWIRENGYTPLGFPTVVYHSSPLGVPPEQSEWEIFIAIDSDNVAEIPETDTTPGIKQVPVRQVLACEYHAGRDDLVATYQSLFSRMISDGYRLTGPAEEEYLKDPTQTPPEAMESEIRLPVEKKGN
ncbi:MAG: GyrI-like domain-containing protein [Peptococcaceae bacterium]|nr:GyrI-like domain-containing protein [Peptococcaceae bacterium]